MNIYIVVPEGISFSSENKIIPSFAFRQVLDYLKKIIKENSEVYFAPANDFKTGYYEQNIGSDYFNQIMQGTCISYKTFVAKSNTNNYIDTKLNAKLLMCEYPSLKKTSVRLLCTSIHLKRAKFCFERNGYKILQAYNIKITVKKERIVSRLWYYQYPVIHHIYEKLAYIRDLILLNYK